MGATGFKTRLRAEGLGFMIEGRGFKMHFLKENERVRIYITANSLKSAASPLLRRSQLLRERRALEPAATNSLAYARFETNY